MPFTVRRSIDLANSAAGRLRGAGAVAIGRTSTPERGFRWDIDDAVSRIPVNPWDANRAVGEFSDAAAVATGMTPLAFGGDDGGALRLAAHECGVTSLRATRGRIAAAESSATPGEPSLALRLFTARGFTARRVDDLAAGLHAIAGRDPGDPWSVDAPMNGPPWPRRVAVTLGSSGVGVDAAVAEGVRLAADALADAGYQVEEAAVPNLEQAAATWATLITAEAHLNPSWHDSISPHAHGFVDDLMEAAPVLERDRYVEALALRIDQVRAWGRFQHRYPIILGPVSTAQPVALGDDLTGMPVMPEHAQSERLVVAFTMLDLPAVVAPVALTNGLPQAVQVAAPCWREDIALTAAHDIERRLGVPTPIHPRPWRNNTHVPAPPLDLQPTP